MFYHLVMMRFGPQADDAFCEKIGEYVARVRRELAGARGYHFGKTWRIVAKDAIGRSLAPSRRVPITIAIRFRRSTRK
jgi:hypothetical protein